MREITLTQDMVALVDDADYSSLMLFNWHASSNGHGGWYAVRKKQVNRHSMRGPRNRGMKRSKRKTIRMHIEIMQPKEGEVVDHKDGNGLNNQRYNLENVTELENQQRAAAKTNGANDDIPF